jgi:hypothetical protein
MVQSSNTHTKVNWKCVKIQKRKPNICKKMGLHG